MNYQFHFPTRTHRDWCFQVQTTRTNVVHYRVSVEWQVTRVDAPNSRGKWFPDPSLLPALLGPRSKVGSFAVGNQSVDMQIERAFLFVVLRHRGSRLGQLTHLYQIVSLY